MAFSAIDVLGVVAAAGLPARAGVHRLAVDAGTVARPSWLFFFSHAVAQVVVNCFQRAIVPPFIEVAPHGAFGREILGEITPLAAGPHEIQNGVHDVAHGGLARATSRIDRDDGLDERPLAIGQVTRILLASHILFYAAAQREHPFSDRLLHRGDQAMPTSPGKLGSIPPTTNPTGNASSEDTGGGALVPVASTDQRHLTPVPVHPALSAPPDALAFLKALRRRWLPALILGSICGVAASLGMAHFMPPPQHNV